jgi:hypothetical protein
LRGAGGDAGLQPPPLFTVHWGKEQSIRIRLGFAGLAHLGYGDSLTDNFLKKSFPRKTRAKKKRRLPEQVQIETVCGESKTIVPVK